MLGLGDKMMYQFTTFPDIYTATILPGQLLVLPKDITTKGFLQDKLNLTKIITFITTYYDNDTIWLCCVD